jgi:DMSO/TMAO reductase YedYZ heme-binding membrane subunit
MQKPSSARDYVIASLLAAVIVVFLGAYLLLRHGAVYFPGGTLSWRFPNQIAAGASALMFGLVFSVGPVSRSFNLLDPWLQYRKEMGIVGAYLALAHILISLFFFFPPLTPGMFLAQGGALIWASIAAVLLAILPIISLQSMMQKLGGLVWWRMQRFGIRTLVFVTLLHAIGKNGPRWVEWLTEGSPNPSALQALPPAGLVISLFLFWVLVVRVYESLFLFRSLGWNTREFPQGSPELARDRRFFLGSLLVLALVYLLLFGRGLMAL